MPILSNTFFSWTVFVILIFTIVIVAISAWRVGKASYFVNLKEKHFGNCGYNRDGVSKCLNQIAGSLSHGYQRRDSFIKSLGEECLKGNSEGVTFISNALAETNARIDRLWTTRHEAEATAKLMGFGQLVDEIHEKGIPRQEPAAT